MTPRDDPEFDGFERTTYDTEDGAAILRDVKWFLKKFVAYPSEAALIAHVGGSPIRTAWSPW